MHVEVDIFSGRPNPRSRLDPAAAAELLRRIAALLPTRTGPPAPGRLGYRGVRVSADAPDSAIAEILVSRGLVLVVERAGRIRRLADADRALERWLLDLAMAELDPGTAELIRHDLG